MGNRIEIAPPSSGRSQSEVELASSSAREVLIVKTRSCHTQLSLGQARDGESMEESSSISMESNKFDWIDPEQLASCPSKRPSVVMFNILDETLSHSTAGVFQPRDGHRPSIFSRLSDISFNSFTYSWNYKRILSFILLLLTIFLIYIFIVLILFSPGPQTNNPLPLKNLFF